ncbi:MAG: response regulator transcription factor [Proteobacteria bacterium]|nr:response regulator transcription factor [Pseudomonadota bacterium]
MRLLVVEDEPALAGLVRGALERAGFGVDGVDAVAEADDYLAVARYDALVLDLGLRDGDGMTLLRRLRQRRDGLPVLILTARDAPEDRVSGLDAGADDYLIKPFHLPELVSRIRALLRRPNAALGVVLEAGNLALDTIERTVSVGGQTVAVGARETALLEMLLRRAGRVVAREGIEQSLYGLDAPAGPNAVEVAIHRLRKRLQDAGATVTIHTVRGVGYLLAAA